MAEIGERNGRSAIVTDGELIITPMAFIRTRIFLVTVIYP